MRIHPAALDEDAHTREPMAPRGVGRSIPTTDEKKVRRQIRTAAQQETPPMNTQQREVEILQAMGKATLEEQQALLAELTQIRTARVAAQAPSGPDFGATHLATRFAAVPTWTPHTSSTDWLAEAAPTTDDATAHHTARTEATLWFGRTSAALRAHREEFAEQAMGMARRVAGAHGLAAPAIERTFLNTVARLHKQAEDQSGQAESGLPVGVPADGYGDTESNKVLDNFQPPVDPINQGVVDQVEGDGSMRAPMVQENAQEQPEKVAGRMAAWNDGTEYVPWEYFKVGDRIRFVEGGDGGQTYGGEWTIVDIRPAEGLIYGPDEVVWELGGRSDKANVTMMPPTQRWKGQPDRQQHYNRVIAKVAYTRQVQCQSCGENFSDSSKMGAERCQNCGSSDLRMTSAKTASITWTEGTAPSGRTYYSAQVAGYNLDLRPLTVEEAGEEGVWGWSITGDGAGGPKNRHGQAMNRAEAEQLIEINLSSDVSFSLESRRRTAASYGEMAACKTCGSDIQFLGDGWYDRGSNTYCDESGAAPPYDQDGVPGTLPHVKHQPYVMATRRTAGVQFWTTPSHGFLGVPVSQYPDAAEIAKASPYSWISGGIAWLEEDDDAPTFLASHPEITRDSIADEYHEGDPPGRYASLQRSAKRYMIVEEWSGVIGSSPLDYVVVSQDGEGRFWNTEGHFASRTEAEASIPDGAEVVDPVVPNLNPVSAHLRTAGIDLTQVRIVDRSSNLFSGVDSSGATVTFRASDSDAEDLVSVMTGDLAVNFSGVTIDESEVVPSGTTAHRRTAVSCACATNSDGTKTTMLCPLHADQDPCETIAQVTGRRRKGSIIGGVCSNCGWVDEDKLSWNSQGRSAGLHTAAEYGDQRACQVCGSDIEYHGEEVGWIDRGGNGYCDSSGQHPLIDGGDGGYGDYPHVRHVPYVEASRRTASDPISTGDGNAASSLPDVQVGGENDKPMWPWELTEDGQATDQGASNVAGVPTPGGSTGYPQPTAALRRLRAGILGDLNDGYQAYGGENGDGTWWWEVFGPEDDPQMMAPLVQGTAASEEEADQAAADAASEYHARRAFSSLPSKRAVSWTLTYSEPSYITEDGDVSSTPTGTIPMEYIAKVPEGELRVYNVIGGWLWQINGPNPNASPLVEFDGANGDPFGPRDGLGLEEAKRAVEKAYSEWSGKTSAHRTLQSSRVIKGAARQVQAAKCSNCTNGNHSGTNGTAGCKGGSCSCSCNSKTAASEYLAEGTCAACGEKIVQGIDSPGVWYHEVSGTRGNVDDPSGLDAMHIAVPKTGAQRTAAGDWGIFTATEVEGFPPETMIAGPYPSSGEATTAALAAGYDLESTYYVGSIFTDIGVTDVQSGIEDLMTGASKHDPVRQAAFRRRVQAGMHRQANDGASRRPFVREAMPSPAELNVSVGDIFYGSWGYDQTNVNFYEVTGLTGASVKVREVPAVPVDGTSAHGPSVSVVPDKGNYIGPEMTKRLSSGYQGRAAIRINDVISAWLWDGTPKHQTGYGYGH